VHAAEQRQIEPGDAEEQRRYHRVHDGPGDHDSAEETRAPCHEQDGAVGDRQEGGDARNLQNHPNHAHDGTIRRAGRPVTVVETGAYYIERA
jgi:hypothetical protein